MDKGLNLFEENSERQDGVLRLLPEMTEKEARMTAPLTLAFIGDAVYGLLVRTMIVQEADRPAAELQKLSSGHERAAAQAKAADTVLSGLTDAEAQIYRRGRNAKPHTTAKNAALSDYMKATGFEAVLGYLYLTGQTERLLELAEKGVRANEK